MAPGFPLSQSSETSSVSIAETEKVRLRLYYDGKFLRDADSNAWKYAAGESYLESVSVTIRYAEFMHKLTEKFSQAVSVKYQIPGEELDPENLITVGDDSDLMELYDEYFKGLQRPGTPVKTFRVKIFVFEAIEEAFVPSELQAYGYDSFGAEEDVPMAQSLSGQWACQAAPYVQCNEWELEDSDEEAELEGEVFEDVDDEQLLQPLSDEHLGNDSVPGCLSDGGTNSPALHPQSGSLRLPSHISIFGENSFTASGLPSRISAFGDTSKQDLAPGQHRRGEGLCEPCGIDSGVSCAASDHVRTQPMSDEYPNLPSTLDTDLARERPLPSSLNDPTGQAQASNDALRAAAAGGSGDPAQLRSAAPRIQFDADPTVHRVTRAEVAITRKIGEGAYGEVSEARINIFGVVAVKWLKPDKFVKHSSSFWQEAQMLHQLNHPNVLRLFGVIIESASDATVVGIMTEFMRGGSLARWLRKHRSYLDLRRRCQVALQAVRGMAYLHERQVVHFDLKPDNLLIDGEGDDITVKVADFGLSRHKMRQYVSLCKELRGTLPYMAPELVASPDRVDEKADVWSMGVVMWEMLTLETPFQDVSPQSIIHGLMMGNLTLDIPGWCEPEWRGLLESCMEPVPSSRPSFKEVARQLEAILEIC